MPASDRHTDSYCLVQNDCGPQQPDRANDSTEQLGPGMPASKKTNERGSDRASFETSKQKTNNNKTHRFLERG